MNRWQMASSSPVVTPAVTWGPIMSRTLAARRPATRIFSISSGVLMVMGSAMVVSVRGSGDRPAAFEGRAVYLQPLENLTPRRQVRGTPGPPRGSIATGGARRPLVKWRAPRRARPPNQAALRRQRGNLTHLAYGQSRTCPGALRGWQVAPCQATNPNGDHSMAEYTMRALLEAGVHFGHQTRYWSPKMKPYIYGSRNKIHIINLEHTLPLYQEAMNYLGKVASARGTVLFVSTKRQASRLVEEQAQRCGTPYVNHRWLGGMLTNFKTVRKSVARLKELDELKETGGYSRLGKKEGLRLERERLKLERSL